MRCDYQCKKCSKIIEHGKINGKFEENIEVKDKTDILEIEYVGTSKYNFKQLECSEIICNFKRLWNYVPIIDVAEGKVGNAKNGYMSGNINKPSHLTPKLGTSDNDGTW